ncbi:hypothetical protein FISHEDRAFT_60947 [Fistulina hepatica ATCC 64428]|uniref:Reverse transcriptase domain-containing protein n=1 Tax=Fistulina hepatica ATCC 64428 TaxID=1128425 RepID=A0A0D7A459_9AGAR|nr:hypothetical protein FISHEDRAFT_60947 [Fistulina hepatica ATCC 64428]
MDLAIEPLTQLLRDSDLEGFPIDQAPERLIAQMFTDDTTVFLSERDSLGTSGAKFNEDKTCIIPLGSDEYRDNLVQERIYNEDALPVPPNLEILKDGETTRILGGHIGNRWDCMSQWEPILQAVDSDLARWNLSHPTIKGRKHIIQMVPGSKTQYLACVQAAEEKPFWISKTEIKPLR